MANQPEVEMFKSRRMFAVFEGGGAKGIFHVATLQALQLYRDQGLIDLKEFAGTSAGAIIAALAASGYQASQLVSVRKEKDAFLFVSDLFDKDISSGVSQELGARVRTRSCFIAGT